MLPVSELDSFLMRVLVIEDDPVMRTYMRVILQNEPGIEVEVAGDGREGFLKFQSFHPDLVIVDLLMPGVDGYDVIEQIRAVPDDGNWLPIMVISSANSDEEPLRAFRLGADEFMVKPVNKEILQRKVRNFNRVLGLQRSNQRLIMRMQAVTDDINMGLVTTDQTGVVIWSNPAALQLFGMQHDQIDGLHLSYLFEDLSQFDFKQCRHDFASRVDGVDKMRVLATHQTGRKFPVELTFSKISVKGDVMCSFEIRDLTDIERIEHMKREFLSVINHELRTPLTSIIGSLSILMSGKLWQMPDKAKNMVEMAHRNGKKLHQLINDILDFEKMEQGQLEIKLESASIGEVVNQAVQAMEGLAKASNITISQSLPSNDFAVDTDPLRFEQILTNLLSNAIKFSESGSSISVTVKPARPFAVIEVQDQGSGIPSEFTSRIFNRFSQAEQSDTRIKGGSGLGLAICKKLVEAMGGTIGFSSIENQGALFYFTIPMSREYLNGK